MARGRLSMWVGGTLAGIGLAVAAATACSAWWRVRYWHVSGTSTQSGIGVATEVWVWVLTTGTIEFGAYHQFPWVDRPIAFERVGPSERVSWTAREQGIVTKRFAGIFAFGTAPPPSTMTTGGSIALWPLAAAPLAAGAALVWHGNRVRTRPKRLGLCERCGYARRGLSSFAACPECGLTPPLAELTPSRGALRRPNRDARG